MQPTLYQSKFLSLAEEFHKKSVHAEWSGKKAEANKYGRLCADNYLHALNADDFEDEFKVSLYWKAVMQHHEVRRTKTAVELAHRAVELIDSNDNLERHRGMFAGFIAQQR
jgi:hypothetical protein